MDDYINFIMNLAAESSEDVLQPVFGIDMRKDLDESEVKSLSGYRGMGPVRIGNKAYEQIQNDVFGSFVLASIQSFFDKRIRRKGTIDDFKMLEYMGHKAIAFYDKPDAGLWELREMARVHTFSAVMCWAACDRLAKIAKRFGLKDRVEFWRGEADTMRDVIIEKSWNADMNCFMESFGAKDPEYLDASLLLLHELGFIDAKDPRFIGTVEAIENRLVNKGMLYRYILEDDFGKPEVAFTICTFWYISALHAIGREEEAREMFENMLKKRNHVGLLSEDMDFETGELWGNFPQTYSMVGMINCAMRLSKGWEEAL
jgi:GH15 family glucan-1,4-alpha-glucosidase